MMKITNQYGLDGPYVRALEGEPHERTGDLSVTRLLAPVQQTILMQRYKDQVSIDAADALWMFIGQIGHAILEKYAEAGALTEELMAVWVKASGKMVPLPIDEAQSLVSTPHQGVIISARIDRYNDGELVDWKLTKTWSHIFGSRIADWTAQLSVYRLMLHLHGVDVDHAHVSEFLIDHVKTKAVQHDYPDRGVYKVPIDLWPIGKTEDWVLERTSEYLRYKDAPDDALPPCTDEERWARPTKWAVYKNARVKRAARLLDSKEEAEVYAATRIGAGAVIKLRPGNSVRCKDYCLVKDFCPQWKKLAEKEV